MSEPLDITELYNFAVARLGGSANDPLPPLAEIRVTLETQMSRTMGRAFPKEFTRRRGPQRGKHVSRNYYAITISAPLLQALIEREGTDEARRQYREVVLHELAHVHTFHRYPKQCIAHGPVWRQTMVKFGLDPDVYYDTGDDAEDIDWRGVRQDARNIVQMNNRR